MEAARIWRPLLLVSAGELVARYRFFDIVYHFGLGSRCDRVGIVAALLLAVNQGNIEYAQQARPYAIQTLFVTAMILTSAIVLIRWMPLRVRIAGE